MAPPVRRSTVAARAFVFAMNPESVIVNKTPSARSARANAPLWFKGPITVADPDIGSMRTSTDPSRAVA
jgi:hypothetical protein